MIKCLKHKYYINKKIKLRYTTPVEIIMYCILLISIVLFIIGAIADITLMMDIPGIIIGIILLIFFILNIYRMIFYWTGKR